MCVVCACMYGCMVGMYVYMHVHVCMYIVYRDIVTTHTFRRCVMICIYIIANYDLRIRYFQKYYRIMEVQFLFYFHKR